MKKGKTKEKEIVASILQYLHLRKVFCWRHNTGGFFKDDHFYRFGDIGSPDLFAIKNKVIFGIEVKSEKGKQTDSQKKWQEEFEKAGGVYLVVYRLEDVQRVGL